MSSVERWSFRPDEDAQEYVERLQQELDFVNSRTDAINFTIDFQRQMVESGSMDIIFEILASEDVTIVTKSQKEVYKDAVKEALAEMESDSGNDR